MNGYPPGHRPEEFTDKYNAMMRASFECMEANRRYYEFRRHDAQAHFARRRHDRAYHAACLKLAGDCVRARKKYERVLEILDCET